MSNPNPAPVIPKWLSRSIVTLLALQVGLLWTHGSLLQRQHDDILALRGDIQALAESLDQDQDGWDSNQVDPDPHPARWAGHQGRGPVRTAWLRTQESGKAPADEGDPALRDLKKEQDTVRQSERDAVAKARDAQEKVSIGANIEKAEAKARLEAEGETWKPWLWAGVGVVVVALLVRALYRRRG
jgi:hypothetical protein